jgi:hypothetical protein
LAVALAAWSACACEERSTPREAPGEARILGTGDEAVPVGRPAVAPDYQMSVEDVAECSLPPPFGARPGHRKISIDVVIEGTSDREVPVNPFYATLESHDGDEWDATLAGCKPVLEARRVVRGQKARGLVTFEIPASARRLRLVYAPIVIGGGREELRFDLER